MLSFEIVRVALDAIRVNKLRSLLTTLGIIIGIAAVIAMVALGEGAQREIEERLESLGTNVLSVRPGQRLWGGVDRGEAPLTTEDAEAIAQDARYVKAVSPQMGDRMQAEYLRGNAYLYVVGVWPTYFQVSENDLIAGRYFTPAEERGRRRVAVLGALVAERLEVDQPVALLGQTIQLRGASFEVIGILEEKGGGGWRNPDEYVYVPLSTAQFRVMGDEQLRSIDVEVASTGMMGAAMAEIDRVLRREHRIPAGQESDFNVHDQAALFGTFQATTRILSMLLAGIAAISLLVGGIGIMNIMIVSVTERTREIGVRKALGAKRRDVMLQFLIESLVLCIAGGVVGLGLGVGGSILMREMAGWNMAVSPNAAVLAIGFSTAVGLFFGIWPARRAARMDPITALRYE